MREPRERAYLLAFDQETSRRSTTDIVERCKDISAWVIFSDNAAVFSSSASASELSAYIREELPGQWFVLTEVVRKNCDGLAPTSVWGLIDNPDHPWAPASDGR